MAKILKMCALLVAVLLLGGCFKDVTEVTVNPDGSGTIKEYVLVRKDVVTHLQQRMTGMAKSFGGQQQSLSFFDAETAKKHAAQMGPGVDLLNYQPLDEGDFEGYRAIYWFRDINRLKLTQSRLSVPIAGGQTETKSASPVLFHLQHKGGEDYLDIWQSGRKQAETDLNRPLGRSINIQLPEENKKKIMGMFRGMKVSLDVIVRGKITATNATYHSGSRITVFSMDLGKLLDHPKRWQQLTAAHQPTTVGELKQILGQMPGMQVDTNDRIDVAFTP